MFSSLSLPYNNILNLVLYSINGFFLAGGGGMRHGSRETNFFQFDGRWKMKGLQCFESCSTVYYCITVLLYLEV